MIVNDLINTLVDGIRKGTISACSPVITVDEQPIYVVLNPTLDAVYITDENPNPTDEVTR